MGLKSNKIPIRKIIVNNEIFYWVVSSYNCDGDGGSLFKIWKDKKLLYRELIHYPKVITPKNVEEQILKFNNDV